MRKYRLGERNDTAEIQRVCGVPFLHGGLRELLCGRTTGIGYANVEALEVALSLVNESADRAIVGDVYMRAESLYAVALFCLGCDFVECFSIPRAECQVCTLCSEGKSGGATDSLAGAGDKRYATFQSSFH